MSSTPRPPAASGLESALTDVLAEAPAQGGAAHTVDGLLPRFVVTPSSVDELAAVLRAANEHGATVVPWGGGRHMALGNIPRRYDVALCTTGLTRIIEYDPADLTVTVEAGITIGRLGEVLADHGQFLPIDAPNDATVGGVLAASIGGPSAHAYRLPRDWLLGCRIAHPDGTVSKGGGRVVKNVAGYDLPRLAVGSLGTLGVIVESTFKLAPLPDAQETALLTYPSLDAAAADAFEVEGLGLSLRAIALSQQEGARWLAAFWLSGSSAAVERSRRDLANLARRAEAQRLEGSASERWWARLAEGPASAGVTVLRASLPRSKVAGFLHGLERPGPDSGLRPSTLAYPTTGLVLARIGGHGDDAGAVVAAIDRARQRAEEAGGTLLVAAAPVAVKERIDVWGCPTGAPPLMRRLKEQFDPHGTLNAGRYVGGL